MMNNSTEKLEIEKLFTCDLCDGLQLTKKQLKNHIVAYHAYDVNNSASKSRNWDECAAAFKSDTELKNHKQEVYHNQNFACKFCFFVSTSLQGLGLHHTRKHCQPLRPLKFLKCDFCSLLIRDDDNKIAFEQHLSYHLRIEALDEAEFENKINN